MSSINILTPEVYEKVRENLLKKTFKISWSLVKEFFNCEFSGTVALVNSAFPWEERVGFKSVSSHRMHLGTVFQKVMEIYFNQRVYDQYPTMDARIVWVFSQVKALYALSVVPEELVSKITTKEIQENIRQTLYQNTAVTCGLDINNFPVGAVPFTTFTNNRGYEYYRNTFDFETSNQDVVRNLLTMIHDNYDVRKIKSEVDIKKNIDGLKYTGKVDFIYNKNCKTDYWGKIGSNADLMKTLADDYEIIDGKLTDNNEVVDKRQLYFYKKLINTGKDIVCGGASFWYYQDCRKEEIPFDPQEYTQFMSDINSVCRKISLILDNFKDIEVKGSEFMSNDEILFLKIIQQITDYNNERESCNSSKCKNYNFCSYE